MPLPRNYYTVEDARDLVAQKFPSENANQALRELLHGWEVPTWIIDRKTGRRVDVPPEKFFKANKTDFHWPLGNDGWIRLASALRWVSGEIRIDREAFDRVLAATVESEAPTAVRFRYEDYEDWADRQAVLEKMGKTWTDAAVEIAKEVRVDPVYLARETRRVRRERKKRESGETN